MADKNNRNSFPEPIFESYYSSAVEHPYESTVSNLRFYESFQKNASV